MGSAFNPQILVEKLSKLNNTQQSIETLSHSCIFFFFFFFFHMNRPPVPATGVSVAGSLDQRPSKNGAWSAHLREKYGLDIAKFTYNPSKSNGYPQVAAQPANERGRCTIMWAPPL